MTKDQVDAVIALGPVLVAGVAGTVTCIKAVTTYFDYLKTKLRETSVGETKIREFEKAQAKVQEDIEELRKAEKIHDQHLDKLDEDYREMIRRVFDFFRGSTRHSKDD